MADESSEAEAQVDLVAYFSERLNLVFAYFYCIIEFEEDEDFTADPTENGRAWSLKTIRHACRNTTLIALRDLDDVFLPRSSKARRSWPSDFKISDFGYPKGLTFLADAERDRINEEIAHSTLPGSALRTQPWDIFELATKGIQQSLEFLDWAGKHFNDAERVVAGWTALYCRNRTQQTYDYFANVFKERQQNGVRRNKPGTAQSRRRKDPHP